MHSIDRVRIEILELSVMHNFSLRISECSSAWLERLVWDQEVAGSNPVIPTMYFFHKKDTNIFYKQKS